MKKLVSAILVLATFAGIATTSSCGKEDINVIFFVSDKVKCLDPASLVSYQEEDFEILRSDVEAAFTSAGTTFDLSKIQEIKFLEGKAGLVTSGNFDDIENIEVYLRPFGASGTGEQIAYAAATNGLTSIDLQFNGTNVATMFKENEKLILKLKILVKNGRSSSACVKLIGGKFSIKVKA